MWLWYFDFPRIAFFCSCLRQHFLQHILHLPEFLWFEADLERVNRVVCHRSQISSYTPKKCVGLVPRDCGLSESVTIGFQSCADDCSYSFHSAVVLVVELILTLAQPEDELFVPRPGRGQLFHQYFGRVHLEVRTVVAGVLCSLLDTAFVVLSSQEGTPLVALKRRTCTPIIAALTHMK